MLKTLIIASLLTALSAAELHIYDVRDTEHVPEADYEWTGILEFNGPPDCNDARGRSGYIAEEDGDATYLGARCKGCSPITDTYADLDIEELEWNNGNDHHFTLRQSEGYQIEPADGSPLRGYCWRDSNPKPLALMTLEEKVSLTGGVRANNSCGGNIPPVERLGFPGMCVADGPAGVRSTEKVNGYPAGIHIGSSWNRNLTYARAYAMAGEFYRKGVTVPLAPAVIGPLGRVAQGGRNWEGFSNDPFLAGVLAADTVRGTEARGVISCTKHFVANEQEIGRNPLQNTDANNKTIESLSTNLDDKTMHELYMWPFADAVHAGGSSIMCSYNRVNNSYACHNSHLMNGLLKTELGFQGFVMSDWSAQNTGIASALAGLDMVMPSGLNYWGSKLTEAVRNGSVPESRIDDMATRILTAWYHAGQDSEDVPEVGVGMPTDFTRPHQVVDARDPKDAYVLHHSATEGHILVKNINNALPLRQPQIVSVFGYDARPISIYNVAPRGVQSTWASGLDSFQSFVCGFFSTRFQSCPPMPAIQFNGTAWTGGGSGAATSTYLISPFEAISSEVRKYGGTTFWDFETYDSNSTVNAKSDVCLVFLNAIAAEGADRPNLRDDFSDGIVKNVAARCSNTVVTIHNAGIRLVDQWIEHPNVTAVLFGHLPGQGSGAALVDLLFGRSSPSGKLPYTVARNESDYGHLLAPVIESNSSIYRYFPQDNFTEGVYIDYRAFDRQNITPRFEFGFGMTYTTFEYSNLQTRRTTSGQLSALPTGDIIPGGRRDLWDAIATVSVQVANTGDIEAAEIAQLYVGIPEESQPVRQLRGFDKKTICVGETVEMEFELKRRDLSVWNVEAAEWELLSGTYEIFVGASSRDLRLQGSLTL